MKNVIFSSWRDFIEISEKDDKVFSKSIFSIYPSINRMFVADDDMTITTHNNDVVYNIKKGDVVFSFQVGSKYIVSSLNDDKIKKFILYRKEEERKKIEEQIKKENNKCAEVTSSDCCAAQLHFKQ